MHSLSTQYILDLKLSLHCNWGFWVSIDEIMYMYVCNMVRSMDLRYMQRCV